MSLRTKVERMRTRILTSRLHPAVNAGTDQSAQRLPAPVDRTWRTTLNTIKLLGFTQVVFIFCAGAIPSPFRLLAFLPVFALAGAALFQAVWFLVDALDHRRSTAAERTQQATFETTVPARGDEQVLSMPRTA
jgi:hypothetical protein